MQDQYQDNNLDYTGKARGRIETIIKNKLRTEKTTEDEVFPVSHECYFTKTEPLLT